MEFKVNENLKVRARSLITDLYRDYSYDDVARIVGYFVDLLNKLPYTGKIGVGFGGMSLMSTCFMLALQKYNKEFVLTYHINRDFDFKKTFCDHMFIIGWFPEEENNIPVMSELLALDKKQFTIVDSLEMEKNAIAHTGRDNLIFNFEDGRKTYVVFEDKLDVLYTNGKIESACIQAAIENYFDESDICILHRPFQHIGVATLSIYPAFFSSKHIIICATDVDWKEEYHLGTNVHLARQMITNNYPMPKKIRMATTGGYNFNSECVKFLTDQSEVETIVDCFGTSFLPPPLAIRILDNPNINSTWTSFIWINKYITFEVEDGTGKLIFSTKDGDILYNIPPYNSGKVLSRDYFRLIESNKFEFLGPEDNFIRMSHKLYTINEFKTLFSERSNLTDFDIEYELIDGIKNPVIFIKESDLEVAKKIINQYNIEANLKAR